MRDHLTAYFKLVSAYRRRPSALGLAVTTTRLVALRDTLPMQCRLRTEVNKFLSETQAQPQVVSS